MPGPKNNGAINQDTYDNSGGFAPATAPTPAKQINVADAKVGPRKGKVGHINQDTFSE